MKIQFFFISFFMLLSGVLISQSNSIQLFKSIYGNDIVACQISQSGRLLVSANLDGTIKLWDVSSGNYIRTLGVINPDARNSLGVYRNIVTDIEISHDEQWVFCSSENSDIKKWNLRSGEYIGEYKNSIFATSKMTLSPDGNYLACGNETDILVFDAKNIINDTIKHFDRRSRISKIKEIKSRPVKIISGHSDYIHNIEFSSDGKYIVSSDDKTIVLWSTFTWEAVKTINLSNTGAYFSYNSNNIFIVSGKEIAYYNTAKSQIISRHTTENNNFYFSSIIPCKDNQSFISIGTCDPGAPDKRYVEINKWNTFENSNFQIKKFTIGYLKANCQQIISAKGSDFFVTCGYGDRIDIWNMGKNISDPNNLSVVESKRPKVWAVCVGISDYSTELNYEGLNDLTFCHIDAEKYYSFLQSPEGGAVPLNQLSIITDSKATKENILNECNRLFKQSSENDLVIFYFSGHGGENIFCTYDGLIKHSDLKNVIYSVKSKKKLCIADACHAGSWNKNSKYAQKALSNQEATNLYYETLGNSGDGIALFMASQSNETSIDDYELKQGLFTYYFIDGLKGNADANYDRIITVQELYEYVKKKVSTRALGKWNNAQNPALNGTFDHNMPVGVRSN